MFANDNCPLFSQVNEVILSRGWRCIDCTVCEGCGRNADEAHLLLCDICDVSFHTYCLDPPLIEVPVGGWKCQWYFFLLFDFRHIFF